jgi:hypothetical protein
MFFTKRYFFQTLTIVFDFLPESQNSTQSEKHEISGSKEVANLHKIEKARSRYDTKTVGSISQPSDQSDSIQQGKHMIKHKIEKTNLLCIKAHLNILYNICGFRIIIV